MAMITAGVAPSVLERAMAETPLLGSAPHRTIRDLVERGRIREYRRATYLFHQGDAAPEVYFLYSGRIEISSLSVTGQRQLHTTIDSPQFFGELGVLGEMPRSASALALDDSLVWGVAGEVFLSYLADRPEASRALLLALARQVTAHESFVEDLLYLDLKGRLAKRLLQLVSPSLDELPPDGAILPSIVTHADLASLCGGSRENVTRILSEFQRRGLVERSGRRYVLKKASGLAKLAGI